MKLKFIAVAALATLTSVSSFATDYDWMSHDALESELSVFGAGVVTDKFSFSLGSGSTYDVTNKVNGVGFTPGFAFYGLFDSANTSLGAFTVNSGAHTVSLAAGDYYYTVFGASSTGGAYSIASAIVATPVPEPETYAMLLAGLGALGFLARRRQNG